MQMRKIFPGKHNAQRVGERHLREVQMKAKKKEKPQSRRKEANGNGEHVQNNELELFIHVCMRVYLKSLACS